MSAYLELLAHSSVAPVGKFFHLLHKLLIHHYFGGIAWSPSFQELDAQEVVEPGRTFILVGYVEQFPVVIRQIHIITVGALERQVVAGCHASHFRKILQGAGSTRLCLSVTIEQADIVEIVVIISRIGVCHHFVLPTYDEHHHHQEHVDEHL